MNRQIPHGERWRSFADSQPWKKGCLDRSSYWTFLRAGTLGIDPNEAIAMVAERINAAGAHLRPGKLTQQLRRAYAWAGSNQKAPGGYPVYRAPRPAFVPDYARKFAERLPADVNWDWLRRRSPLKVPWLLSPAEFLFYVYELGDRILVFTDQRSQGQELWEKHSLTLLDRQELRRFVKGHDNGVWFLSNPVSGQFNFNERQQTISRRSEESVTSFRFAILESDCQSFEQWLRILVQLPLPIVSITGSGGKSLHALVRVDASSKAEWDELIGAIKPRLVNLGADAGALTAVRLTRLPNCYRGDRLQELIYLNPRPTGDPISEGVR